MTGPSDGAVVLRSWCADDAEWYAECARDPEVQRFTTDPPTLTAADVAAAIAALADHPERVAYLIADPATGERLGNIAVDRADGVGDVSYWVAAAARGRGVATRALELVATAALRDLHELRLWTHVDNLPSRRAAERAGFVHDPARDQLREVKGAHWPTVAYRRGRGPERGPGVAQARRRTSSR